MKQLDEKDLPLPEKLLLLLHNLCAIRPDKAKKSDEVARVLQLDIGEVDGILSKHEAEGYAKSFTDSEGNRRYYLTGIGIIKVCSLFT